MKRYLPLLFAATSAYGIGEIPRPDVTGLTPHVTNLLTQTRTAFEGALERAGNDEERAYAYGQLAMFYHAQQIWDAADVGYRNAGELAANDARWPYLLAVVLEKRGNASEARTHYERSMTLQPQYPPTSIRLGLAILADGEAQRAEELLRQALRLDPYSAAAMSALGQIALQADAPGAAVEWFKQALSLQPGAGQLHQQLALAYRKLNEIELAKAQKSQQNQVEVKINDPLLQSIAAFVVSADDLVKAGDMERERGNMPGAAEAYRRAAELEPDHVPALISHGLALDVLGDLEVAQQQLARAAEVDPNNAEVHFQLGRLRSSSSPTLAVIDMQRAVELDENHFRAHLLLADLKMHLHEFADAEGLYGKLSKRYGELAILHYWAGMASIANGDCRSSIERFRHANEMKTGFAQAMQAEARALATCQPTEVTAETALGLARRLYRGAPEASTAATLAIALAANQRFEAAVSTMDEALFAASRMRNQTLLAFYETLRERFANQQPAHLAWSPSDPAFDPLAGSAVEY